MSPAPCPGSCNNAWRKAEANLAADGTEHTIPATWGQPVHCDRCTGRARQQLAELPELVAAISLEALNGTPTKMTGTIGRATVAVWPGQASRILTDHIVGGILELEDDIRELRRFRHRPGRGTEGRNVTGAVRFLSAHLSWALVEHPSPTRSTTGCPATRPRRFRAGTARPNASPAATRDSNITGCPAQSAISSPCSGPTETTTSSAGTSTAHSY